METKALRVLTRDQLAFFEEHGYLRMQAAFPRELALELQDEIWTELAELGLDRDDRATWKRPPHSPRRTKHSALASSVANERFVGAASDLIGDDEWKRPAGWGGFLVTFPNDAGTALDVPTEIWHWDGPPDGRGLLIFSFHSEVRPGGGGTMIVDGSHRLVREFYASLSPADRAKPHKAHRKLFSRWHPWLEDLTGQAADPTPDRVATFLERSTDVHGVRSRVVELTGEPGDVVFCNLGTVHVGTPNRSDVPRFMRVKFLFLDERESTSPAAPVR